MSIEQVKRQVKCLEFYLKGRMNRLTNIGNKSPADKTACDMAKAELQLIYDNVLPEIVKATA